MHSDLMASEPLWRKTLEENEFSREWKNLNDSLAITAGRYEALKEGQRTGLQISTTRNLDEEL